MMKKLSKNHEPENNNNFISFGNISNQMKQQQMSINHGSFKVKRSHTLAAFQDYCKRSQGYQKSLKTISHNCGDYLSIRTQKKKSAIVQQFQTKWATIHSKGQSSIIVRRKVSSGLHGIKVIPVNINQARQKDKIRVSDKCRTEYVNMRGRQEKGGTVNLKKKIRLGFSSQQPMSLDIMDQLKRPLTASNISTRLKTYNHKSSSTEQHIIKGWQDSNEFDDF